MRPAEERNVRLVDVRSKFAVGLIKNTQLNAFAFQWFLFGRQVVNLGISDSSLGGMHKDRNGGFPVAGWVRSKARASFGMCRTCSVGAL